VGKVGSEKGDRSSRQGRNPAGGSPAVPVACFRHVAMPVLRPVTTGVRPGEYGPAAQDTPRSCTAGDIQVSRRDTCMSPATGPRLPTSGMPCAAGTRFFATAFRLAPSVKSPLTRRCSIRKTGSRTLRELLGRFLIFSFSHFLTFSRDAGALARRPFPGRAGRHLVTSSPCHLITSLGVFLRCHARCCIVLRCDAGRHLVTLSPGHLIR
jgi:hypothetical protein